MNDVETPMGNTELRLAIAAIQQQLVEIKAIAEEGLATGKKTNGRVSALEKWKDQAMGGAKVFMVVIGGLGVVLGYALMQISINTAHIAGLQANIKDNQISEQTK